MCDLLRCAHALPLACGNPHTTIQKHLCHTCSTQNVVLNFGIESFRQRKVASFDGNRDLCPATEQRRERRKQRVRVISGHVRVTQWVCAIHGGGYTEGRGVFRMGGRGGGGGGCGGLGTRLHRQREGLRSVTRARKLCIYDGGTRHEQESAHTRAVDSARGRQQIAYYDITMIGMAKCHNRYQVYIKT